MEARLAHRHYPRVPTPSKHTKSQPLIALGAAIRRVRKSKGLSQEELAQMAGLDRSYLGGVERGESSIALVPLLRVAAALDTTVATLMSDAEL